MNSYNGRRYTDVQIEQNLQGSQVDKFRRKWGTGYLEKILKK